MFCSMTVRTAGPAQQCVQKSPRQSARSPIGSPFKLCFRWHQKGPAAGSTTSHGDRHCLRARLAMAASRPRSSAVTAAQPPSHQASADFPSLVEADIDTEYLEVPMHGCRFLMAIDDDHLLLNNVRISDDETGDTSHALLDTSEGELPQQPHRYQFVPWMRHISGDHLKYEDDEYQLLRIFLVKKKSNSDMLDLETVVCLDAETRQIGRVMVDRVCSEDVPEEQISLRIREGILTLEQTDTMPPPGDVVGMHDFSSDPNEQPDLPQQEVIPAASQTEPEEMEDDMDTADDAPAVDLA